jgi:pimeloyl-ACP methyl ester carboxylesterase
MAVSEALLDLAKRNDPGAIDILTFMGYSNNARIGNNKNPGMWMTEGTRRLMQRSGKDVIFKDLLACSNYVNGLEKAKKVSANTLLILGENDYLTPKHRAKDLINNFESVRVKEIKNSGHTLMVENPNLVLDYLSEIL